MKPQMTTTAEQILESIKHAKTDYCIKRGLPIPEFADISDFYITEEMWHWLNDDRPRYIQREDTCVEITRFPTDYDWWECKRRALITIGKKPKTPPTSEWKHKILEARHSPIRDLRFSWNITCPSWISGHLVRHVHAQPYVSTQRNDRQARYDRRKAPQDASVDVIFDTNAEELMVISNKRLCGQASAETSQIVQDMCTLAETFTPELHGLLVPMCVYHGGVCHEMNPCGRNGNEQKTT
jgi:hypothetical protein